APPLMPGSLETSKPTHLNPADFAVSPLNPVLARAALRIDGIERCLDVCPKPFCIVRMHPLLDLLDRRLVPCTIENFFKAPIYRDQAVARLILPPPKQSCVKAKLQTILARPQSPLRLLALDCKAHPANEDRAVSCQRAKQEQVRHSSWV